MDVRVRKVIARAVWVLAGWAVFFGLMKAVVIYLFHAFFLSCFGTARCGCFLEKSMRTRMNSAGLSLSWRFWLFR